MTKSSPISFATVLYEPGLISSQTKTKLYWVVVIMVHHELNKQPSPLFAEATASRERWRQSMSKSREDGFTKMR